ncbi:MAG: cupin domain-containing protein [Oscillospiraceae bacterium]|nr:cupin domain-containing protein [Oscillospiraceae bacterium]
MEICNVNNISSEFIWKDDIGLVTKMLGSMANTEKLYVNIDSVPTNAYSTKYHSHSQQEEFFLILNGCGTLRLNEENYSVKKGDFFSKPAGRNIAHTFYNSGSDTLVILDIGTVEKEDTCYYPDEEVYLHKTNGTNMVFKKSAIISDWTSDPNKSEIICLREGVIC